MSGVRALPDVGYGVAFGGPEIIAVFGDKD